MTMRMEQRSRRPSWPSMVLSESGRAACGSTTSTAICRPKRSYAWRARSFLRISYAALTFRNCNGGIGAR